MLRHFREPIDIALELLAHQELSLKDSIHKPSAAPSIAGRPGCCRCTFVTSFATPQNSLQSPCRWIYILSLPTPKDVASWLPVVLLSKGSDGISLRRWDSLVPWR